MNTDIDSYDAEGNDQDTAGAHPGDMGHSPALGESLFPIFWRGRWLLLLTTVLALTGAYVYLRRATPVYTSLSRILVERPSPSPHADIPQPVGSTLGNYLQTQATMITSPEIVSAALRDPNALTLDTFANPRDVQALVHTLSAEVGKKADVIQITASSAYPEEAARLVNAVVRAYIRWHEANRQLTTADLLKDLNVQLENRYHELQLKRKERMLFEQRHPEVVDSTRGGIVSKTLDLLKQELAGARLAAAERDAHFLGLQRFEKEPEQFRQYVFSHAGSTPVAAEEAEPTRWKEDLHATQLQLETLAAGTGAAQRAQITLLEKRQADLEKKIAAGDRQFVQNHLALAKALAEDAHAREQKLAEMYEKEFSKVQNQSEQDSEYAFLASECEMIENLCNSLLSQINQLDLNARREGLNIHVLEKAMPAPAPSAPQPARVLGIGSVLGLLLGAGFCLVRDGRDPPVRSAAEITMLLGRPILGAIPSIPRGVIRRGQRFRFASHSRESEVCRAIRTLLLHGARPRSAQTILVTSPGPREGKTTLVNNLAITMAWAGQKTLIVDADLRKPRKERVFVRKGHEKGLVDVLTGTATLQEAIRPAEIEKLDVLESGCSTPNPSELLNGRALATVLEQLRGQYDRILIDSPPVGIVTDAQILAAHCSSTLLVVRAEKSSRLLTQQARDALLAVGAAVVGAVVNDVPRRDGKYGAGSGYGYYHSPGSNGHQRTPERRLAEAGPDLPGGAPSLEAKN